MVMVLEVQTAFQPSKTTVKAVADSTGRPRRSGVNYKLKRFAEPKSGWQQVRKKSSEVWKVEPISNGKLNDDDCNKSRIPGDNHCKKVPLPLTLVEKLLGKKVEKPKSSKDASPKRKRRRLTSSDEVEQEENREMMLTSSSYDGQTAARSNRLLMRQWLEMEADKGSISGLKWFDEKERLIQIKWRHGSRSEWLTSDVNVFKCWAQYTGRYNANDKDYKRWKANFRCALNSLQDVEEVKEKRSMKAHDPYKVYRLLPAIPPKRRRRESVLSSHSSSAESTFMMTEEAIQTDSVVADIIDPVDPFIQDMYQQLLPLLSVSAIPWSVDGDNSVVEMENVAVDVPLTCLNYGYSSDAENVNQMQLQPSPPAPTPFNDAIPIPVLDLIESSEEFQAIGSMVESTSQAEDFLHFYDPNVGAILTLTGIEDMSCFDII